MAARLFSTFLMLSAAFSLLTPSLAYNLLKSGEFLYGGQSLTEGSYTFIMQTDCNLVLYDSGRPIWASGTNGKAGNCFLAMQNDGNLVIYSGTLNALWASNTQRGKGNFVVVLQKDRNVVLYGPALWATGTNHVGTANVIISSNSTEAVVIAGDKNISMVTDTEK